jgi:hypothetical protein
MLFWIATSRHVYSATSSKGIDLMFLIWSMFKTSSGLSFSLWKENPIYNQNDAPYLMITGLVVKSAHRESQNCRE